jgi:signal peptidase
MDAEGEEKAEAKRLSRGRQVARTVVSYAIVLGAALAAYYLLGLFLNTDTPLVVVPSGSMRPVIEVGDILVIQGVRPEEIRADPVSGDVIVFWQPGGRVRIVHRAIDKNSYGVVTKGDANAYPDFFSPVPYSLIIGKWTGIKIPYWTGLGYLALILRGELYPPLGQVIWISIAILVALSFRDLFSSAKKRSAP